jgi:hypothetical protein
MARFNNRLDHVRIAAPCKADWDQMIGNERVRFCSQCCLNVYNLSSMNRSDAEALIARTEGRLCVSFYRRSDGSIITKDCPIGLRTIRRRLSYVAKAISSTVIGLLAGLGIYGVASSIGPIAPQRTMGVIAAPVAPPVRMMGEPIIERKPTGDFVMGRVQIRPIRHRTAWVPGKSGSSDR